MYRVLFSFIMMTLTLIAVGVITWCVRKIKGKYQTKG